MKRIDVSYLKLRIILALTALSSLAVVLSAGRRWG
jgi:hypothetical protein